MSAKPDSLMTFLEMITGMDLRMQKKEASQVRLNEDERMRVHHDSGLFKSEIEEDFAGGPYDGVMKLEDLHDRQPQHPERRVPARLNDLRMRTIQQPMQRINSSLFLPAFLPPHQPTPTPQVMPVAQRQLVQQQRQVTLIQYCAPDAR
uniref:Uncharacterized protein n=1 Tax=Peronospora matthiolae TaxID=2874970 RepID=A0AAV1UW01_9STRA